MRDLAGAGRFRLRFTIPGRLPGLNKYTRACRSGHQAGNAMKQAADGRMLAALRALRSRQSGSEGRAYESIPEG